MAGHPRRRANAMRAQHTTHTNTNHSRENQPRPAAAKRLAEGLPENRRESVAASARVSVFAVFGGGVGDDQDDGSLNTTGFFMCARARKSGNFAEKHLPRRTNERKRTQDTAHTHKHNTQHTNISHLTRHSRVDVDAVRCVLRYCVR